MCILETYLSTAVPVPDQQQLQSEHHVVRDANTLRFQDILTTLIPLQALADDKIENYQGIKKHMKAYSNPG